MIVSLEWLKDLIAINEPAEQVADRLIQLGAETELLDENRLDLEITPNRGDLLSIFGVAREYGAAVNCQPKLPELAKLNWQSELPDFSITLDSSVYHRLSAMIIRDVNVKASPDWLKRRLEAIGMNSINNLVDLTNYVMIELGIPIHAFDLDQLPGHQFQVRTAEAGERFISLKGEALVLPAGAIVVECDGQIIDLLGIRGGQVGMIQPNTKNLLVWAASLPRPLIRQTVRAIGIKTDAAYRHERETDWAMVPIALQRIAQLLAEQGGKIGSAVDYQAQPLPTKTIDLQPEKINQILGTSYRPEAMVEALERLGFRVNGRQVVVPSWRYFDINRLEDLAEEVARLEGYQQLPRRVIAGKTPVRETGYARLENIKDQLIEAGFTEVYTESLVGRQEALLYGYKEENLAILANPVNRDFSFCRPAIVPGLLKLLVLNSWADDARIFEIGAIFPAKDLETTSLAIAAYGDQQKLFSQWLPADSIEIIKPDHPLARHLKLRRPVTAGGTAIDKLKLVTEADYYVPTDKPKYRPVSPLPPAVRDLAIIIDQSVQPEAVIEAIKTGGPQSLIIVELFDQFAADRFGPDRHSLAFHLVYQSTQTTLDAAGVEQNHQAVIDLVKDRFRADIR